MCFGVHIAAFIICLQIIKEGYVYMNKIGCFLLMAALLTTPVLAEETELPAEAEEKTPEAFVGEDGTVTGDLFSVRVPEEILEICDLEVREDSISFYEKISHEAFGGHTGTICLYDKVEDYTMLPSFDPVGELHLEDGTLLHVIAMYPTDVQFDVESEESTDNYRAISEAFRTQIIDSIEAVEGSYIPQAEVDTTSIYNGILDQLTAEISERKTQEELTEDGFCYLFAYLYGEEDDDPLASVGYAFTDLDHDGYQELLVGSMEDPMIYEMYAQLDGEVKQVFCSGERDRWYLTGKDEMVYALRNEASGGAMYSVTGFYNLVSGDDLYLSTRYVYDSEKDAEHPFYIGYFDDDDSLESVSEEEWNDRMGNYGETMAPAYQPLSGR